MKIILKNKAEVVMQKLTPEDWQKLSEFLYGLSEESKSRFGPHGYSFQEIQHFFCQDKALTGYVARMEHSEQIIAYFLIRKGFLSHDSDRLQSYGLELNHQTDCTLAPAVADEWQSKGLGFEMLQTVANEIKSQGFRRMILWGGVQATNAKAVRFYQRNGFKTLGLFEYHGQNLDMIREL